MSRPFQPWQRPLLWALVWMFSVKGLVQRRLHGLRSSQKKRGKRENRMEHHGPVALEGTRWHSQAWRVPRCPQQDAAIQTQTG